MLLERPKITPQQKYFAINYLNKLGLLSSKNQVNVRIQLFKVYFKLFSDILKNPEEMKQEVFKKDRTKSKKQQIKEKKLAMKKIQQIKENGDIDQGENKIVELILKGINIILSFSKTELREPKSELK
jgi:hypothetical protein